MPNPQLEQLLQLAQVAHLVSQPGQQQQEIDQREQAARLTAAIHLMGMQQERESQRATLEELTRYHTGELQHGQDALAAAMKEREMTAKSNVLGDLLRTPGADVGTVEDTLASVYPEYGAARTAKKAATVTAEVQKFTPIVAAAKDDKVREQILASVSPEARTQITAQATPTPTPSDSTPTPVVLGRSARQIQDLLTRAGGNPLLAAGLFGAEHAPKTTPKGLMDFINAYLNKPQPAR